ncbi:uncharacterized protein EHS24_001932 [Apiotrichum porosum]|uniref:Uncharacterized protein n=1 Tax=Apiotrichum porosum TaxID=105984 RepID=A0A427XJC7_9TREE|nr:uncharacterized protein EHS24_001932 [Apiotrichum porosum]RSH79005.1 hypothetical protein EHS24_001932 [Apiotrichum porosum]
MTGLAPLRKSARTKDREERAAKGKKPRVDKRGPPPPSPKRRKREPKGPSIDCSKMLLDSAAYPHIVEAILENASYEVLLAFRQTNSQFQQAADVRLFFNVTAAFDYDHEYGSDDCRSNLTLPARLNGPLGPLPGLKPLLAPPKGRAERARRKELASKVRMVDYWAPLVDKQLLLAMDNVILLRRAQTYPECPIRAAHIVEFIEIVPACPRYMQIGNVPDGTFQLTVNIDVNEDCLLPTVLAPHSLPKSVRAVKLVFNTTSAEHYWRTHRDATPPQWGFGGMDDAFHQDLSFAVPIRPQGGMFLGGALEDGGSEEEEDEEEEEEHSDNESDGLLAAAGYHVGGDDEDEDGPDIYDDLDDDGEDFDSSEEMDEDDDGGWGVPHNEDYGFFDDRFGLLEPLVRGFCYDLVAHAIRDDVPRMYHFVNLEGLPRDALNMTPDSTEAEVRDKFKECVRRSLRELFEMTEDHATLIAAFFMAESLDDVKEADGEVMAEMMIHRKTKYDD